MTMTLPSFLVRSATVCTLLLVLVGTTGCVPKSETPELPPAEEIPRTARLLTMRAPEMFCIGCEASVESAVGAVPGVLSVDAIIDTKEVRIIYDPAIISGDEVIGQGIFDVYGREFISDTIYQSS